MTLILIGEIDKMKIAKIERKDVWVTVEFSAEQLSLLKQVCDHVQIEFDSEKEPEMIPAVEYFNEHFYAFLKYFEEHGHTLG